MIEFINPYTDRDMEQKMQLSQKSPGPVGTVGSPGIAGQSNELLGTTDVVVPREYSSINKSIHIVADKSDVTITFSPNVAEEIGAYRRCKSIVVKFKENGNIQILPMA